MSKELRNLIGIILLAGVLIAGSIKFMIKDVNIDLNKSDQITGTITECGIMEKSSLIGGKAKMKGNCFYFMLDNLDEILASYRPQQNYSTLIDNLHIGDEVTVYYQSGSKSDLNLNVYQIEKNGQIIQDYKSYNSNHKDVALLLGILGFLMIVVGIIYYKYNNR